LLKLILGHSGTGKTQFAIQKASELARNNAKVILIVPEQITFKTEKMLIEKMGASACLNIEVLSFTRLAQRVFKEFGGLACSYIDDCGRYIIMRLALKQVSDILKIYQRQASNAAFTKTMVDCVAEYKTYGITPEMFEKTSVKLNDGILKQKLTDISLIMQIYNALLNQQFADSLDDLVRLDTKLEQYPFFKSKTVIIDEFKGFTAQEKRIISRILTQADDVYITLCTNSLDDTEQGMGLFSLVKSTARQLINISKKAYVDVAMPQMLSKPLRFKSDDLFHLEENIFSNHSLPFKQESKNIHIASAANIHDEAQYVAQTISTLVREYGSMYKDIVVIAGDMELYKGIIDPVFAKYDIPLFFDNRRSIDTHPLMVFVLSLLDILNNNFKANNIFRYLKTGILDISIEDISALENYVMMWDIKGLDKWQKLWEFHPDGYGKEITESDKAVLDKIEQIKNRFLQSVISLKNNFNEKNTGKELVINIYNFLCSVNIQSRIDELCNALTENGEIVLADEYARIWEVLITIFDQLALTLDKHEVTLKEFASLLQLVIVNSDLGHIPASLDEVIFGSADRIRAGEPKYVFVIGLADGIFPKGGGKGGVFSENERKKLIENGLELASAQEQPIEERFFAYKAFTAPTSGLYLSTPRSDASGRVLRQSYFLTAVKSLYPNCDIKEEALSETIDCIQNEKSAFEQLALNFNKKEALKNVLMRYFESKDNYTAKLEALHRASVKQPFMFKDKSISRQLYGEKIHISPSRAETHRQCKFLYFCKYGIKARPRNKAELAAPEVGTLIHFVLEHLLSQTKEAKIWNVPKPELDVMIKTLLDEYAQHFLGGLQNKPERFKYLFYRLEATVISLVEHICAELSQSEFVPVDFELVIGNDGVEHGSFEHGSSVKPLTITLKDGGNITVEGKIDRVDIMKKNKKAYIRVIDYKTGSKIFKLNDVVNGLNLQMLIYLFSLCENAKERYAENSEQIFPAGVLYLPAKRPNIDGRRDTDEADLAKQIDEQLKMSGIILDDAEIAFSMEKEGKGIYIPAKIKAEYNEEGNIIAAQFNSAASIASIEQFGQIKVHIIKTLKGMAKYLRNGNIAATPVNGNGYNPCEYCDFMSVCGIEPEDKVENLQSFDKEQVWELLKGDGDNGEA
jgi:ATP-dependent helicase/nuclease subunit B